MKQGLVTILCLMPTVLCLAMWVRSYWGIDYAAVGSSPFRSYQIASGEGGVCFATSVTTGPHHLEMAIARRVVVGGGSGTVDSIESPDGGAHGINVTHAEYFVLPYWLLLVPASVPAFFRMRVQIRRDRRQRLGLCRVCGYDLRATPERCPECGTAAKEAAV